MTEFPGTPGTIRPIPEDFAQKVSELKTRRALREHYSAGYHTMARWIKESGVTPMQRATSKTRKGDPPPNFAEKFKELQTMQALQSYYHAGWETVSTWFDALGIEKPQSSVWECPVTMDQIRDACNPYESKTACAQRLGISTPSLDRALGHFQRSWDSVVEEVGSCRYVQSASMVVQDAIADWSEGMGMPLGEDDQCSRFDYGLVQEEADELREAIDSGDRVAQLDALGDLVYVCFNIAARHNLPLSLALGEIHRSNETKTPNGFGKPTKGPEYREPDLEAVLRRWDAKQGRN